MFDTMTLTKAGGAFCGALLVFLLGNWAADILYSSAGGHGDEHQAAYVIEVEETGASGAEEEEGPDFATVFASADASKGAKVFGKCRACHKLEAGANGVGPTLFGVVGRAVDSVDGYSYSGALEKVVDVWDPEHLNHFLEDPKGYAPGTKMGFSGLGKIEDRANLIAYLETIK